MDSTNVTFLQRLQNEHHQRQIRLHNVASPPIAILQKQIPKNDKATRQLIALSHIIKKYTWISVKELKSKSKEKSIVHARHLFFYMAVEILNISSDKIGRFCGNRYRNSVITGRNKIKKKYWKYQADISMLRKVFNETNNP